MMIGRTLRYIRYLDDFEVYPVSNVWEDTIISGFGVDKVYVVFTLPKVIERCILMATDPGDLVLDPTCGSGTTAYVAEQWGRRWITIGTSRVALALARTRLMAARYPWYLLADSADGRGNEAELTGRPPVDGPTGNDLRQGFVYERVPHITLKSIANNSRIDDIWEKWQAVLEPRRGALNAALGRVAGGPLPDPPPQAGEGRAEQAGRGVPTATRSPSPRERGEGRGEGHAAAPPWEEWEVPREAGALWPAAAREAHAAWWEARIARQAEIDLAIAAAAEVEKLYDRPYTPIPAGSASPARSRSRACRRTASPPPTRRNGPTTSPPPRAAADGSASRRPISRRLSSTI
jgi:adenine-specific DNA-methyltransferase